MYTAQEIVRRLQLGDRPDLPVYLGPAFSAVDTFSHEVEDNPDNPLVEWCDSSTTESSGDPSVHGWLRWHLRWDILCGAMLQEFKYTSDAERWITSCPIRRSEVPHFFIVPAHHEVWVHGRLHRGLAWVVY